MKETKKAVRERVLDAEAMFRRLTRKGFVGVILSTSVGYKFCKHCNMLLPTFKGACKKVRGGYVHKDCAVDYEEAQKAKKEAKGMRRQKQLPLAAQAA